MPWGRRVLRWGQPVEAAACGSATPGNGRGRDGCGCLATARDFASVRLVPDPWLPPSSQITSGLAGESLILSEVVRAPREAGTGGGGRCSWWIRSGFKVGAGSH